MTTYIISIARKKAVVYTGKMHHMSLRSAVRNLADDAMAISYGGEGGFAKDLLKVRSAGETHLSVSERELIDKSA